MQHFDDKHQRKWYNLGNLQTKEGHLNEVWVKRTAAVWARAHTPTHFSNPIKFWEQWSACFSGLPHGIVVQHILRVVLQQHGGKPSGGLHGWFGSPCCHLFRQPRVQSNEAVSEPSARNEQRLTEAPFTLKSHRRWEVLRRMLTCVDTRGCAHTVKHDCLFTIGHVILF